MAWRSLALLLLTSIGCQKVPDNRAEAPAPAEQPKPEQPKPEPPKLEPKAPTPPEDKTLYNGKTVAQWLAALDDPNSFVRQDAIEVLGRHGESVLPALLEKFRTGNQAAGDVLAAMGPASVPPLCAILEGKTSGPKLAAGLVLLKKARFQALGDEAVAALTTALADSDPNLQAVAVDALTALGPKAKAAAPALAERLKKSPGKGLAVALWRVSGSKDEAFKALTGLAKSERAKERAAGFEGLAALGPDAADAVPLMVTGLKDQDAAVRVAASAALAAVGAAAKSAIPELIKALEAGGPATLAEALGRFGADAKAAVPILVRRYLGASSFDEKPYEDALVAIGADSVPEVAKVLSDPDWFRQRKGAELLGRFGPVAKAAVGPLTDALASKHSSVRTSAATALGRIGPAAKPAVAALLKLLDKPEDHLEFYFVVKSLEDIGAAPAELTPPLVAALKNTNADIRRTAADALGRIGPPAKAAVPDLIPLLKEDKDEVRAEAASALGRIGPSAREAVPELCRLLKEDKKDGVREAAATALGGIGPEDPLVIPALAAALSPKDFTVSQKAAEALGRFGPKAAPAVPALATAFQNSHVLFAHHNAKALAAIGPAAKDALPVLRDRMKTKPESNPNLDHVLAMDRVWAAFAVYQIGADEEALAFLVEALKTGHRREAARALGQIGPKAKVAVPALIEAAKGVPANDFEVRGAALEALKRIDPAAAEKIK